MRYLIGVDGGGTRTTLALADETGREIQRSTGPAGLVDPRRPEDSARMLAELAASARSAAGLPGPAAAMCAGLAGVGHRREREMVARALEAAGVAEHVLVCSDGETALHGALGGAAGVLLIAGTGSIGYGRAEDGRVERCGGWGREVGDEGSGFAIGRDGLRAAVRAADGRGPATELLAILLHAVGLSDPEGIPSWIGRSEKAEIAALAVEVLARARGGDAVALEIARNAAAGLAEHAAALIHRLGRWTSPAPVAVNGGLTRDPTYSALVAAALRGLELPLQQRAPAADAVTGAVQMARKVTLKV